MTFQRKKYIPSQRVFILYLVVSRQGYVIVLIYGSNGGNLIIGLITKPSVNFLCLPRANRNHSD